MITVVVITNLIKLIHLNCFICLFFTLSFSFIKDENLVLPKNICCSSFDSSDVCVTETPYIINKFCTTTSLFSASGTSDKGSKIEFKKKIQSQETLRKEMGIAVLNDLEFVDGFYLNSQ